MRRPGLQISSRRSPVSGVDGDAVVAVPSLDLTEPRAVHIVGVAGAGMSAIALLLARMGHRVSGSDIKDAAVLSRLRAAGVTVHVGNDAVNVPSVVDAVVYSTAVPRSNPELVAAHERGVAVLHRSGALAAITAIRRTIAVAGSHGKTTTTSMLALALREAGWSPSFLVGADVNDVATNAAFGDGEWLVLEADESDGTFLRITPEAAIVTNVEPDHLDHYGSFAGLVAAFEQFADAVPGPLVCGVDDAVGGALAAARPHARTYGEHPDAHYRVSDRRGGADGCRFTLVVDGEPRGELAVPTGVKAATNAAGAAAMAMELGVDFDAIARALRGFAGVVRRFQYRGARDGITFVDDYAHLPAEVAAAIATARESFDGRVLVVFQPHRYSRTAAMWADFAGAFVGADKVFITDVYAAGESPIAGVSGRLVAQAVADRDPEFDVVYVPRTRDLARVPTEHARPGDVVLTLGAGDLTALPDVWLAS
jgi:UDP-N-acetylmuramate--alanine ligase